ncbi:MAG TPA: glyoxylate/hydroxypyruvate reductase A [Aquabacterium sp.]|nr:glyoxylate/hydroxypyruvate reductase A [Aquabacterium sp.]
MNLLLTGSFDAAERDTWAAALRQALPGHRLLLARGELADDAIDAAIVANPPPGSLQGLPRLQLIQTLWAGVDRLLGDASLPAGVPVARMVDPAMNAAMAETALWAVLALHRGFFTYARQQQQGRWQQHAQRRADEVPVLVLGLGQMGGAVVRRLQQQGYPVTAWRRGAGDAASGVPGVHVASGSDGLHAALAGARVLVNLLPLTPDTRGLLDAALFNRLPRGAAVVNLARGAHVVDADLLAALASGQVGHAVLDVFHAEPLAADHPFWAHPRVTVLPHVAAQTDERSAAAVVAANIDALAAGAPLRHLVRRDAGY